MPETATQKTYCSNMETVIKSGDDTYDLISAYQAYTVPLALKGIFADLSDTEYLDFSQPWWELEYMQELLLKNDASIYFIQGDIALYMLGSMGSVYYNKRLLGDIAGDGFNINSCVDSGEWTLEKFGELAKNAYSDVNGNGTRDDDDIYGFGATTVKSTEHFMYDAGITSCTRDADGFPTYTFNNERSSAFIEKLHNLYYENDGAYIATADSGISAMLTMFTNGRLLFLPGWLYMAKTVSSDAVDDYGIIPYPKYDENQEKYLTLVHDGTTIYCIPVTVQNMGKVSAVTEALCAESWRRVTPEYFEVALKNRYASDAESAKMIDTIRAGITTDFFYANNYSFTGSPGLLCRSAMAGKMKSISSLCKQTDKSTKATLKSLIEDYESSK